MNYNIGIIGGGQLGAMMAIEAHKMGYTVACLDPTSNCPASFIVDKMIVGEYNDLEKLNELGSITDHLSYEFENVPGNTLELLNNKFDIPQGIQPLLDSQDRLIEKDNANKHGLKTAKYYKVDTFEELNEAIFNLGLPCIYKTRREGYDGHGQVVIQSINDMEKVKNEYLGKTQGIVEEMIHFDYETSLILVRSKDKTIHFPMGLNIHKDGILDLCEVPLNINQDLEKRIVEASTKFMESANYYGILTIEFFIKGNDFYFNEMAPRPHNSGHYTIEGCSTNQFKELDKFVLGLELEKPELVHKCVMKNILGRDLINIEKLKQIRGACVHMYNKEVSRPLRKMGHITYIDLNLEEYNNYLK